MKGLCTEQPGIRSLLGPGPTEQVSLMAWRQTVRIQEVEFELARTLTQKYLAGGQCDIPAHILFPQMLTAVRKFINNYVYPMGNRDKKDVLLNPYYSDALEILMGAIGPDTAAGAPPELPLFETNRGPGSTREVDFWTSKQVIECHRSHLNWAVADTLKWEQSAKVYLDMDDHVISFVRNFNLGFSIPYFLAGERHEYIPDFLIRLKQGDDEVGTLILEIKGFLGPVDEKKRQAAIRWVNAVNNDGRYGRWAYDMITDPSDVPATLKRIVESLDITSNPKDANKHVAIRN